MHPERPSPGAVEARFRAGRALVCALCVSAAAVAACSLTTDLDGLTGGRADAGDASPPDAAVAPGDTGAPDALPADAAPDGDDDAARDAGVDACPPPEALAADAKNCGACGHDCLGGACLAGRCQPVQLASGQGVSRGLAVDATHVYWASRTNGTVARVAKAGGAVQTLAQGLAQPADMAVRLALTAEGPKVDAVVVLASGDGTLRTMAADGGTPRTLATAALGDAGGERTGRVAIGARAVYYTNASADRVVRVDEDSGAQTTVAAAENNAFGLAVGHAGGERVFWVSEGPNDTPGGAYAAQPNGTGRVTLATGMRSPRTLAIGQGALPTDVDRVAWVTAIVDGGVYRADLATDGGTSGATLLARVSQPWAVVDHAQWGVFFTSFATPGAVYRCPPGGCGDAAPETLASGLVQPTYLAVDELAVYVVAADGNVYKVAR